MKKMPPFGGITMGRGKKKENYIPGVFVLQTRLGFSGFQ